MLLGFALMLAARCPDLDLQAEQSPALSDSKSSAAAQPANSESVIRRLAGVWKEDLSKRKTGAGPNLRFRRLANGGLEEFRGPEVKPEIQPVILDGRPYPVPGSSNSIAWQQIDADRFERELFGEGRKLLYSRRLRLSTDGNTLTEESVRAGDGARTSASYRRVDGEPHGLAGTWIRESIQGRVEAQMTFEPVGANAIKVSANSYQRSVYTVTLGGASAPLTGEWMISRIKVQARKLDDYAIETSSSRDGSVFSKSMIRVSADGKTMTLTTTPFGPDGPRGEPSRFVFLKQ
jgi:hypothetical protein